MEDGERSQVSPASMVASIRQVGVGQLLHFLHGTARCGPAVP